MTYVAPDKSYGGYAQGMYDPWGNGSFWPPPSVGYYRWNGAWGYLRFDALGLYYVHGRWYSPDTGLFLPSEANGSYQYSSNPDPLNKGWLPLLGPTQQLPKEGYIYTKNWGFFDINHINAGRNKGQQISDHLKNLARSNPLILETGVGNPMISERLVVNYDVNRPIPEQLHGAVALGIFIDYENRWERFQGRSPSQSGSS